MESNEVLTEKPKYKSEKYRRQAYIANNSERSFKSEAIDIINSHMRDTGYELVGLEKGVNAPDIYPVETKTAEYSLDDVLISNDTLVAVPTFAAAMYNSNKDSMLASNALSYYPKLKEKLLMSIIEPERRDPITNKVTKEAKTGLVPYFMITRSYGNLPEEIVFTQQGLNYLEREFRWTDIVKGMNVKDLVNKYQIILNYIDKSRFLITQLVDKIEYEFKTRTTTNMIYTFKEIETLSEGLMSLEVIDVIDNDLKEKGIERYSGKFKTFRESVERNRVLFLLSNSKKSSCSVSFLLDEVIYKELEKLNKKHYKNQGGINLQSKIRTGKTLNDYISFSLINSGFYAVINTVAKEAIRVLMEDKVLFAVKYIGAIDSEVEGEEEVKLPQFEYLLNPFTEVN